MKKNIIIQAPVFSMSGYGAHSRDIVMAIIKSGMFNVSLYPVGWGATSTGEQLSKPVLDELVFAVQNQMPSDTDFIWLQIGMPDEFRRVSRTYNIGITAGVECTNIPQNWVQSCTAMDKIYVPSTFTKDTFLRGGVRVPVEVLPEGVDLSIYGLDLPIDSFLDKYINDTVDTKFNFMFSGQWMNAPRGADRKQVATLIESIFEAFKDVPSGEVGLILKTSTINNSTPDRNFTGQRIEKIKNNRHSPKLYLLHGELTELEEATLYRHPKIHAFVSATSGEGWNRPAAQAVASDMPVGITKWSGHMDFINPEISTTFEYVFREVPIQVDRKYFPPGSKWAIVDLQDLKDKLVIMRNNYDVLKQKAIEYGKVFREKYSLKVYDALIQDLSKVEIAPGESPLILTELRQK